MPKRVDSISTYTEQLGQPICYLGWFNHARRGCKESVEAIFAHPRYPGTYVPFGMPWEQPGMVEASRQRQLKGSDALDLARDFMALGQGLGEPTVVVYYGSSEEAVRRALETHEGPTNSAVIYNEQGQRFVEVS